MSGRIVRMFLWVGLFAAIAGVGAAEAAGAKAGEPGGDIARGQYLVKIMACDDCHTAGALRGQPDLAHALAGSDTGFWIPGQGVFYGPNLTPDKKTGLGDWSKAEIVAAITKGVRPDGRVLTPTMPWPDFASLTQSDALAIAAYLKSLAPISRKAPGPFGESQTPTGFVMPILPRAAFAKLPKPPAPK